jgi:hypothetical protein
MPKIENSWRNMMTSDYADPYQVSVETVSEKLLCARILSKAYYQARSFSDGLAPP